MSSDVERELAHAKAMAVATHLPDCRVELPGLRRRGERHYRHPDPACDGCVTDRQRQLWEQLATEYQAHLNRHREDTLL